MKSIQVRKLTYAALFLALALAMPHLAGRIPEIGKRLSLMHIPVLLCGFLCGWSWGMAVGFISPLMSSVISQMPVLFPDAVVMAFELAAYGSISGLLYRLLPRKRWSIYITLIVAMIIGRIVYGIVYLFLLKLGFVSIDGAFMAFVWTRAFTKPLPGIVLHIVLIPILVMALERAGLSLIEKK